MSGGTITEIAGGSINTHARGDVEMYTENMELHAGTSVEWKGDDNGVILGADPKDPDEDKVLVKTAYFAKRIARDIKIITDMDYLVKKGDTHGTISKSISGVRLSEVRKEYPKMKVGDTIKLKVHSTEKGLFFEKIEGAGLGAKVFIVVETFGLQKEEITIEVVGSNNTTFVTPGQVVPLLVETVELTSQKAIVGAHSNDTQYINAPLFLNKAVAEVELRPQSEQGVTDWRKKITDSTEKKAFLSLKVTANSSKEVLYNNEDEKIKGVTKDKGLFLNNTNKWFRVTNCFCYRDITEEELKDIVKEMRTSEDRTSAALFTSSNCTLADTDKTYARLCEEINKTCRKYSIDSCIRKIHFMSQTYWEGDRLGTTLEYSSGEYLNPGVHKHAIENGNTKEGDRPRYKGRGLIQLTWRNTQKSYFEYILKVNPDLLGNSKIEDLLNRSGKYKETYFYTEKVTIKGKTHTVSKSKSYDVDSASLIASSLLMSVDSAGWFWAFYKKSAKGLNLNELADFGDTNTSFISKLVNGGGNGLSERGIYYQRLKDNIFKLKENCANYECIKK